MSAEQPLTAGPAASQAQSYPQQHSQLQPDPSAMKLTRGTSCVLCQQRKVRCDKNKPCANCIKAKVECRVIPPQPPRRRKKRLQEKDLIERLKKYETLLTENGVSFDSIGQDLRDSHPMDDVDELENDFEALKTSPEASSSPGGSTAERMGNTWFSLHREFRASENMLHDSSEDEENGGGPTIYKAFDRMFDHDGFPFVIGGPCGPITSLHPPTIHIFQLWQIYLDNINPLLKITHIPTVQGQIIEATSQLDKAPKNIEALMFGIYLVSISSLDEGEVQRMFKESKKELLGRYHSALQQALTSAGFMRFNDPITLQAYLLYLLSVRWFVDPRQVFCLIGIAVRIAQRMGLHRDPAQFGLPPYEVEQRRRLWWTLVSYDRRIGEMSGSTVTALSSGGDCRLPLNVNDSDLHIDGKEAPTPHSGPTEMLFALTRMELAMAVSSDSNRDSYQINNPNKSPAGTPNSRPQPTTIRLAGQDGPTYTMDGFCAHMEGTYLAHCDPKIPLHFFTLTMTRQALCKMRIVSFLVRNHDGEHLSMKDAERDNLFLQATQMIEYDNVIQSSESLRPFRWFSMHHFPFPAYMFLVLELRQRVAGPGVERAWEAISRNHDLRGLFNNFQSPMYIAFGNHFIKAWDTHEAEQVRQGRQVKPPAFLTLLRERAERRRQARMENQHIDPQLASQHKLAVPHSQGTPSGDSEPSMMTPPIDPASGAPQHMGSGSATSGEDPGEMDWSYLMSGYNDASAFPSVGSFAGFGSMGGMGGMGGMPGMSGMGMGGMPGMGGNNGPNMFGG